MIKVNNKNTKRHWRFNVFIVNLEQILEIVFCFHFDFEQVDAKW